MEGLENSFSSNSYEGHEKKTGTNSTVITIKCDINLPKEKQFFRITLPDPPFLDIQRFETILC